MRRHKWLSCLAVGLAVALCGCEHDEIKITVEPRPDGSFHRTARFYRIDGDKISSPTPDLVRNAEKAYPDKPDIEDATVTFHGDFRAVPPDIHHAGSTNQGGYVVWQSHLGYVGYYRERRPGRTDLYAWFADSLKVLDTVAKVTATVVREQLKGEEGVEQLAAFIEGDLRRDVKEVFFYASCRMWLQRTTYAQELDEKAQLAAIAIFVDQFAEERGYFKAGDVPKLFNEKSGSELLLTFMAKQMGRPLDAALRRKLAFVSDEDLLEEATKQACKSLGMTEEQFEKQLQQLAPLIPISFGDTEPVVRYTLKLPTDAECLYASSRFDDKEREVRWKEVLDETPVTHLFFAVWATPDAEWQEAHLGRTILRGEKLAGYVLWVNSLTPAELAAWHAAIDKVRPGEDLAEQLSRIRLTPDEERPEPEEGARMLIDALEPLEEE